MSEEHLEKIKSVIKNNSDYKEHYNLHDYFEVEYIDELVKENERLNNIIDKFEQSFIESDKYIDSPVFKEQLKYLQELKGSDNK